MLAGMTIYSVHPGNAGLTSPQARIAAGEPSGPMVPSVYARALATADRACCCSASPAVLAIMPPAASRPHRTELLFCMHHYRAASPGLAAAGALVIDATGEIIAQPAAPRMAAEC
jgi:hypothetical protein